MYFRRTTVDTSPYPKPFQFKSFLRANGYLTLFNVGSDSQSEGYLSTDMELGGQEGHQHVLAMVFRICLSSHFFSSL